MCGIIDDLLPVIGAVGGFFLGGPAGAALGGALGGATGNYAQTHNWGSAALGGVTGGLGGYFGGGSLANALSGLGSAGMGATSAAFDTGLASNVAPATLGGLEGASGGAALFGPMAGTGTAIGSAAGALGGGGLGMAGGDALSGISASPSFLGALGGGSQGTGLGVGGAGSSAADLSGVSSATQGSLGEGLATPATNQGIAPSPMGSLAQTTPGGAGITATPGSTAATTSPMGSNVLEGSQAATTGSGAPYGFDAGGGASLEGSQAAMNPGASQGALAAMYGPNSTAAGSTIGQGISGTGVEVPGASNVQYGALGEGTANAPGMATGAATTGAGKMGDEFAQYASPLMRLFQTGYGAYQQHAQQQAQQQYANQINQEFAPNSPYAQQMAQTLARQDAAAGRNSQYGNRAVQLAAALTQARIQALGNQNYYRAATATPGANMLNTLFSNFMSPQGIQAGRQLYNLGSAGVNSLVNLFGG